MKRLLDEFELVVESNSIDGIVDVVLFVVVSRDDDVDKTNVRRCGLPSSGDKCSN